MNSNIDREVPINSLEYIQIFGAKQHFLKDLTFNIPRNKLVIITGVSGSGKSSLAFDTIYAEAQRMYMETFMVYARNFIGGMKRPDVDKIIGLSPSIAIEQKTVSKNPKSTVGTVTDIYDFVRLFYARCGTAYSYNTGDKMVKCTDKEVIDQILNKHEGKKVFVLAPVVRSRKGIFRDLFKKIFKLGHKRVRVDGVIKDIVQDMHVDRYIIHNIEVVVDELEISTAKVKDLQDAVGVSFGIGNETVMLLDGDKNLFTYSKNLMDVESGLSYGEASPNLFSFNSHEGMCKRCDGLGEMIKADLTKLIPDASISIYDGAIESLGKYRDVIFFKELKTVLNHFGADIKTPVELLPEDILNYVLYGCKIELDVRPDDYDDFYEETDEIPRMYIKQKRFEGVVSYLLRQAEKSRNSSCDFIFAATCSDCNGARLKKEALAYKISGYTIQDVNDMSIRELHKWFSTIGAELSEKQYIIAKEILEEINKRVKLLLDMGLDYLSLGRALSTLSGGESQRIRLATQIGTQLVGVLYILDEPSIGLHPKDNDNLIQSLKKLVSLGNTVIVVEHDKDIMLQSDYIIDMGPGAGVNGGEVVASGSVDDFKKLDTITAHYLSESVKIVIPPIRRTPSGFLSFEKCRGYNLKSVDVNIPLGCLVCITGPSGSGKSTLINETVIPALKNIFYKYNYKTQPFEKITGVDQLSNLVEVTQEPIGRTPRSNPATYTGIFDMIRNFFSMLPSAKIKGFNPGRFSFNVKGGRCEGCEGGGVKHISMNFLEDVYVQCLDCRGKRYNRETLDIKYHGQSISDVLDMTVDKAVVFFEKHPAIQKKLITLQSVGLGYITLGQHATTLSGGEAQRVKLATELSKRGTAKTIYILDEPTTGLHFSDIDKLVSVINALVDKKNTVIVIEHNLDIIKISDWIIDLGPGSGPLGGHIVAQGTPEQIISNPNSITGQYLKLEMQRV